MVPMDTLRSSASLAAIALLGEPTRRRLFELVAAHGPVSRDAAAQAAGISRELAAFHLDKLVNGGLLETSFKRLSGRSGPGAGRPAKLYQRSSRGLSISLPERRYEAAAELFAEGLESLADDVGSGNVSHAVNEPARREGRQEGMTLRREIARANSVDRKRKRVIQQLADDGFEPKVDPVTQTVTLGNCPYRALSESHRDLTCGMNLAWAEGLLDGAGDVGLVPVLAYDPGRCCVVFKPADKA